MLGAARRGRAATPPTFEALRQVLTDRKILLSLKHAGNTRRRTTSTDRQRCALPRRAPAVREDKKQPLFRYRYILESITNNKTTS